MSRGRRADERGRHRSPPGGLGLLRTTSGRDGMSGRWSVPSGCAVLALATGGRLLRKGPEERTMLIPTVAATAPASALALISLGGGL
jgi:hypothetical protein